MAPPPQINPVLGLLLSPCKTCGTKASGKMPVVIAGLFQPTQWPHSARSAPSMRTDVGAAKEERGPFGLPRVRDREALRLVPLHAIKHR